MSKATQKSELGEDELLQELAYLDQAEYIDKQAYAQLVKIMEQHFAEQSGEVAGFLADLREVVDGSGGVDGWHLNDDIVTWEELNITVDRIDAFLQQKQGSKRVVTRAWIEKELNAHLRLEDEALRDYVHVIADIIVEIFTAFGIEVVEK